jgi:hypothetical protein
VTGITYDGSESGLGAKLRVARSADIGTVVPGGTHDPDPNADELHLLLLLQLHEESQINFVAHNQAAGLNSLIPSHTVLEPVD